MVANETFEAKYPFGTDLEGRFLYVAEEDQEWLLATFDFSYMWRSTCLEWRRQISAATGIPISNIWLHTTQCHSGPSAPMLDGTPCRKLVELSIPVIHKMIAQAEETELSYTILNLEGHYNFNREVYVPELGAVTAWGGLLKTDSHGPPYTQDPDVLLLCGYRPDLAAFKAPIYFDRPADPLAALLVFRSRREEILGTLCRFSGHPDIAASCTGWGMRRDQYHYDFDWPGYVRRRLEQRLGGVGICVNGPCGNVGMKYTAPDTYQEVASIARRIGEEIAIDCLQAWQDQSPLWEPVRLGAIKSRDIDLPIRENFPHSRAETPSPEELESRVNAMIANFKKAQSRGECPARIKQMADEIQFTQCINKFITKWTNITDEELERQVMTVELQVMRLNDFILAGFPGETMTETGMWLRAQTIGAKLITFDQINGYHMYMTNDEAHAQGGYSYWGGLIGRRAEPLMRQKAMELIKSICH